MEKHNFKVLYQEIFGTELGRDELSDWQKERIQRGLRVLFSPEHVKRKRQFRYPDLIVAYYGLGGEPPCSFKESGQKVELASEAYVRKLLQEAIRILRSLYERYVREKDKQVAKGVVCDNYNPYGEYRYSMSQGIIAEIELLKESFEKDYMDFLDEKLGILEEMFYLLNENEAVRRYLELATRFDFRIPEEVDDPGWKKISTLGLSFDTLQACYYAHIYRLVDLLDKSEADLRKKMKGLRYITQSIDEIKTRLAHIGYRLKG